MTNSNGLLLDRHAHNAEKLVAAWLAPIRRSGAAYMIGDPLPFTLITKIGGAEAIVSETADPLVSVHTLCDRTLGYEAAAAETDTTHRAMVYLCRWLPPVTLPDGRIAAVDYGEVFQSPIWIPFEDVSILRTVGRYKLGQCYTAVSP